MSEVDLDELEKTLKEEHQRQNDNDQLEYNLKRQLQQDQEEELESIQILRDKIQEVEQDEESRELQSEIYSHCCKNSFGFLHPVIGMSDTSLEWYKVIKDMVPQMKHLDEFLKRERTEKNIGKILPSNFCSAII